MKRLPLILVLFLVTHITFAQQEAMFSFYDWNKQLLNPAVIGEGEGLGATLIHRSQWVGFDGAPVTQSLTLDAPVMGDAVNLGLSVLNDKAGPVRNVGVMIDYAFRLRLTEEWKIAMGLKAGFNDYVFDLGNVKTIDLDRAFSKNDSEFDLNIGLGAFLSSPRLTVGFAIPKILENRFDYAVNGSAKEFRHYYVTGGYAQPLGDRFTLRPTTLVKVTSGAPVEGDLTLTCIYDQRYWFGMMGRSRDGIGLQCGAYLGRNWALGYAFDWSIANTTGRTNAGSHEVMLHYEYERGTSAKRRTRQEKERNQAPPIPTSPSESPSVTVPPAEVESSSFKPTDNRERMVVYNVTVLNQRNGVPVEGADVSVGGFMERTTDSLGKAEFVFAQGTYPVDVRALGYNRVHYNVKRGDRQDTVFMTVALNRSIVLKNIYYDFDKYDLRPESIKELEKVVSFMKANRDLYVELGSHTDSRGNDEYNQRLSENRAKSAVDYIISRGISPERIRSKGYGESRLVNGCSNGVDCTEAQHQLNRRTEIIVSERKP